VRYMPLPLAVCASLFLLLPGPAAAAGPDPVDQPVAPADEPASRGAGRLETQMIPELGQTIIYVRFPDAAEGTATLELLDSAGDVRASSEVEISGGTGLTVWDGRDAAGERLPSDLYVARLSFAGRELTAPLVR